MAINIRSVTERAADRESHVIATPEGDNEMSPDQPLQPAADTAMEGLEDPRGSEPDAYKRDHGRFWRSAKSRCGR